MTDQKVTHFGFQQIHENVSLFDRFSEFLVSEFLEFSKNVSLVKHSLFLSATVLMFLILYDLLFQIQEKSRRSINKKGRNTLVDLI